MLQDSQSLTTSSVDVWLNDHPDQPESYVFGQPKPSKKRKAKRPLPDHTLSAKFQSQSQSQSQSPKRRRLMEVSGNNPKPPLRSPERKLRASKQVQTPATPTRRERSKTTAPQPTAPTDPIIENSQYYEAEDPEQMPTPRPNPASKPSSLQPRPTHPVFQAPLSHVESSGSGESRGSKKARSQSPTKRLGDLQCSDMPVDSQTWSSGTIPQELKDLVRDMQGIGRGAGVIPLALRGNFGATEEMILDFQWAKEEKRRGKEVDKATMKQITGGLGHELFWYRASMICEATNECLRDRDPEPAWNSEVHSAILRLALTGHWSAQEVWYKDITVARISNKSLVPWNIATGAMQSKMVDYAILINPSQNFTGNPSESLHNHIIEKLRREKDGTSINQTESEWVRFKPIAVNIETKRGAVGEDEAHVQLATWLTAQYSRLRQLMPDKAPTKLPSFPVLSVQGQRWLLMIASLQDNDRINLIKELYLGDTDSMAGVYQVVAAIRRIAWWVNDDYRPWFEKAILGFKSCM